MAKNKYNKPCNFCIDDIYYLDYKDVKSIKKLTTKYARIVPRYYSGTCLKHQKHLAKAVKKSRFMALLPFVR